MGRFYVGTTLAAPRLPHTMTKSAEAARQSVRDHRTKLKAEALVTKHAGRPQPRPDAATPAGALKLLKVAKAIGYDARLIHGYVTMNKGQSNEELAEAVLVGGKHERRGYGFRAVWVRGRAYLGLWYARGGSPLGEVVGVTEVGYRVGIERPKPKGLDAARAKREAAS